MRIAKAKKPVPRAKAGSAPSDGREPVSLPPASLMDFCGVISAEEADQMIHEIEEAFEHTDGE